MAGERVARLVLHADVPASPAAAEDEGLEPMMLLRKLAMIAATSGTTSRWLELELTVGWGMEERREASVEQRRRRASCGKANLASGAEVGRAATTIRYAIQFLSPTAAHNAFSLHWSRPLRAHLLVKSSRSRWPEHKSRLWSKGYDCCLPSAESSRFGFEVRSLLAMPNFHSWSNSNITTVPMGASQHSVFLFN